jgi:cystathionine beta-lyase/cystathionine gamma-synthase
MNTPEKDLSYIINVLGEERENYFNAVSPPVIQSSNFSFRSVAEMRADIENELDHPYYTRGHNPTVAILRKKVAALEGAEDALMFGSGVAAISAAVMSQLKAGDHAVCVSDPYGWTDRLFKEYLPRYGVTADFVFGADPVDFEKALKPNTKVFYLESPNSVTFQLQDIEAVSAIAKRNGITVIVDNSCASPLNQSPLKLGADIVVHSATKYLNGHSDVVAGALCSSRKLIEKIFQNEFMNLGGILSPHDAWLMIRGLRTLELRMDRVAETTAHIIQHLENHPKIEKIYYPFSKQNPQLSLAQKQMSKGSGQFSVLIKATEFSQIEKFCDGLQRFLLACSWGGHESLVYPLIVSPAYHKDQDPNRPWNLVRFYIGLENADVLLNDIQNALEKI